MTNELELLEELYTLERQKLCEKAKDDILSFTLYTKEDYIVNWHHKVLCDKLNKFARGEIKRMMVFMSPQHGKLLSADTPILTTKGWKNHGDLTTSDYVFGQDGKPKKVILNSGIYNWNVQKVIFNDGNYLFAAKEHLWNLKVEYDKRKGRKSVILETQEIFKRKNRRSPYIDISPPLDIKQSQIPIDPYILGCWLGDGHSRQGVLTVGKEDISHFSKLGESREVKPGIYRVLIKGLTTQLRENNLLLNKHIPIDFILSSKEQRFNLLRGLMDTDGCIDKRGNCEFTQKKGRLAEDVYILLRTLGIKARKKTYKSKLDGRIVGYKTRILFNPDKTQNIFALERKQKRLTNKVMLDRNDKYKFFIKEIINHGEVEGNCIQVEDGMYLAGYDLIPTHNSELTSRRLPAYMLGRNPNLRIALCAYNTTFASKFNRQVQRIITDKSYSEIFPDTQLNSKNVATDSKGAYLRNSEQFEIVDKNGSFISVGVGGGITGNPVDIALIDDPIKGAEEAGSQIYREKLWEWYTSELETRLNNNSQILITLTRWNIDDLAGRILKHSEDEFSKDWEVIVFPRIKVDNSNPDDPRKTGEALWPEIHSLESALEARQRNPIKFEALQQQNPKVMEYGNEFYKEFNESKHIRSCKYDPNSAIHISLDENVHPYITGTIYQIKEKTIYQIDEVCLVHPKNTLKELALEFSLRYSGHYSGVFVYGDATSKKQDTKLEKGQNFFTLFCKYISEFNPSMRVPKANPSVAMRGNFINEILSNNQDGIYFYVDPRCHNSIADLRFVKEAPDGTKFKQLETDVRTKIRYERYGHCSDSLDYLIIRAFESEYSRFQRKDMNITPIVGYRNKRY